MISTIQDVLLAYTGLSDKRNLAIAAKIEAALEPCIAAERAAAAEAMREACATRLEEMRREHNAAMIGIWHTMDTSLAYGDGAEAIRALPIPDASALAEREKEAYRRGWLDRESDFMAGVERTGMAVTDESALAERDERMREEGRREEREACVALLESMRAAHNTAMIGVWHTPDTAIAYGKAAAAIRARSEGKG